MSTKKTSPTASPIDTETMQTLRERVDRAGSTTALASVPGCPLSEDTILRALGGRPLRGVSKYALRTWLAATGAAASDTKAA